jgi:acetolactate synthase-1/2/3 large subunit
VVLALPEDVLREMVENPPAEILPNPVPGDPPRRAEMKDLAERLARAERPVMILGGTRWTEAAVRQVERFAERAQIPVGCSFRRQMLFDHTPSLLCRRCRHRHQPGAGRRRSRDSDLVLLVGGRFSEMPSSGYTLMDIPCPEPAAGACPRRQRRARPGLPPDAGDQRRSGLLRRSAVRQSTSDPARPRRAWWRRCMTAYLAWSTPPETGPGDVHMGPIIDWLRNHLPEDAILTNGAGNYATWVHRYVRFRKFATQAAPASGSMGYGVPAAVGRQAGLPGPHRRGLCRRRLLHDARPGIRHRDPAQASDHRRGRQQLDVRHHPHAPGARLPRPRQRHRADQSGLRSLARAYGGHGETVEKTEDFAPAFERAQASGKARRSSRSSSTSRRSPRPGRWPRSRAPV